MNAPKIALLAYLALGVVLVVAKIGKPREPIDPPTAVVTILLTMVVAWLVVIA